MSRPPPFLDDYLLYLLAKASAVASGQFHAELAARGIAMPTWRILAVLSDGPATVGRLAEAVLLKQATLSKTLDRLVRDDLVSRERSPQDRRGVTIRLTPRGQDLTAALLPLAQAHQKRLLAPYDQDQAQTLMTVLRDFIAMADQAEH